MQSIVTFVVYHQVKSGKEAEYRAWQKEISMAAASQPGFLGSNILLPATENDLYTTVVRFDNTEHLRAWVESDLREDYMVRVRPLLQNGDRTEIRSGIEYWFPAKPQRRPAMYKQFLLTLAVIYPLTLFVPVMFMRIMNQLPWAVPHLVGHLFINIAIVSLMILLMPQLMRRLAVWLYG